MTFDEFTIIMDNDLETGFRLLLKMFKEPLYWHARRITVCHEDAQDAVQEAFVRIYRSYRQRDRNKSFTAWVYRIVTNEALRIVGRHKDNLNLDDSGEVFGRMADQYVDYNQIEAIALQKAILSLPRKQGLIFNLRYYDELSFEEIATIVDSTPSAVKAGWHIAKGKIMKQLEAKLL